MGGGFLGSGGTLSVTFGSAETSGQSSAFTETFTEGTGIANATGHSAPNAINHHEDLFLVWLNPAVSILPINSYAADYSIGTQAGSDGQPEPVDQVEIYANDMMGSNGHTTVPLQWLEPIRNPATGAHDLPGLAAICAHPLPTAQCTQSNQCGCVPSDFTTILAQDPLLHYGPTNNPLDADTSGAGACGLLPNPGAGSKCRYLPVPSSAGSSAQLTEHLVGPSCSTCNIPVNTVTLSDATMASQSYSESSSWSVGYSWKVGITAGPSWASGNYFKWTDSESSGSINGHANTMNATFESSTVDCVNDISVFYDTVYHTFVFEQQPGDSSCP